MIPYSKPFISNLDIEHVTKSMSGQKISGDGEYTKRCTERLNSIIESSCLLTTSCTDALEMSATLLDVGPGDEIIIPSYTFVSTALPFDAKGAKIIFVDSEDDRPHMNIDDAVNCITDRTKAIVPVHYAGESIDFKALLSKVPDHVKIVEDNAQGISSKYNGQVLGTVGDLGTLSFHDTKNVICGEGGALIINDKSLLKRSEIIREKGTNRSSFFRGEVDKYGWVDTGSSYLPSDIVAALLYSQLSNMEFIQNRRLAIYNRYINELAHLDNAGILTPKLRDYSSGNGHIYYLVCKSLDERTHFINYMKELGIYCVSHYVALHSSEYYKNKNFGYAKAPSLPNAQRYTDCLVRLPAFVEMTDEQQAYIIESVIKYYKTNNLA